jgi:hypothetical protein
MKKLSKIHIGLMISLVAVLAGGVYFLFSYQAAAAKQPDIQQEINMALMKLETIREDNQVETLIEQLDELRDEIHMLSMGDPLFPEQPATVEIGDLIVDTIHRLAPNGNLVLLKLNSDDDAGTVTIDSDISDENEGNRYSKAEYEVKVQGDLGRINSLIGEIEGADFATLYIEEMEIDYHPEEEEGEHILPAYWEAEFKVITLYQYEEEEE